MRTAYTIVFGSLLFSQAVLADTTADEGRADAKTDLTAAVLAPVALPPGVALIVPVEPYPANAPEADLVCERSAPTGSRISNTRCVPRAEAEMSERERQILRRDVEEMRRTQMGRELARRNAAAAMMSEIARGRAGN